MKTNHIKLSKLHKDYLREFLSKGSQKVGVQKRALALQLLDGGKSYKEVERTLAVSYPTVLSWAKKYRASGLDFLVDKPRSGAPSKFDGLARAEVTALACSTPPKGYERWSLRLLSDRLVSLEYLEEISHTEVGRILKKTNCNLIAKNNGVFEK
jgi:transposase